MTRRPATPRADPAAPMRLADAAALFGLTAAGRCKERTTSMKRTGGSVSMCIKAARSVGPGWRVFKDTMGVIHIQQPGTFERREAEYGPQADGFVYFIKCGEFVKIGRSDDPKGRLLALRIGNPFDLTLLHTVPGDAFTEEQFHGMFATYRHRLEWFRFEGELRAWIEAETGQK